MDDRISDLPDDVLGHIVSFLTLKEAVRSTALLSRRWRRMNVFCSDLDFRDLFLCSSYVAHTPPSTIVKKNRRSLKAVDKILLLRRSRVEKFYVNFSWIDIGLSRSSIQMKLDKWIHCLAKPALAVLDLRVMFYHHIEYFSFPLAMLASQTSLQVLNLYGFHLSSSAHAPPFSSLHSLSLERSVLDDGVMEKIFLDASHLRLKNLQLCECVGIKTLNIRGLLHLKKLEVEKCKGLQKIDIDDVPTLEVLVLSPPKHMISIASFPPCLRKLDFCSGWYFRVQTVFKFQGLQLPIDRFFHQFFTLCPLLEVLDFEGCPILQTIGHLSTTMYALNTLHLLRLENMVKFEIIAPNLETFYIDIYINVPIISLDASDKLLEVTVMFNHSHFPHDQVAEFLGTFNHCRAIKISFNLHMGFVIAKELRNNLASPLYGTKCLDFSFPLDNRARRLSELVDYMLWLSPQATSLKLSVSRLTLSHPTTEIVLECVYEKNGREEEEEGDLCPCCKLVPVTCWRHCLKEVRIQEFLGDEVDKENVKSYFLEQVENLIITDTTSSFDSDSILHGGLYSSYDQLFE